MPELPIQSPGEIIASDFTNDVARRTVQRYASVAVRSAENPTPEQGDVSFLSDTNQFAVFNGTSWGGVVVAQLGNVGAPSYTFAADEDTGMFQAANNAVGIGGGGVQALRVSGSRVESQVIHRFVDGSLAAPALSFISESTSGFHLAAPGNVQVGASGVANMSFRDDRTNMHAVNLDTTAQVANMYIQDVDARVFKVTSARKYKSNIHDAGHLADLVLEPVTFHHDGDAHDFIGFIADDMPDERAIIRGADGEVENYDVRAVVAILAAKVNALTQRLNELEGT